MAAIGTIIYYIILVIFTLASFFVYSAIFLLTVLFDRNRVMVHWAGRVWSWVIFHINFRWRVKVEGRNNIQKGKAYVAVANHCSMIDIPMLYVLPMNFKWVSKVEVLKWPVFGIVLWMQDNILIRRGEAKDAKKFITEGVEVLHRGVSAVVFPEGTRSADGEMRRFKEGAFMLAQKAGVEILPVVTYGTGNLTEGWKLRMPHTFKVKILPPIDMADKDPKAAAVEIREMMEKQRKEMML